MPGRVEPADVCASLDQAHRTAVELFDQQRFFEAHEFFEWAWKGPLTPDEDRPFYKGLAQLAVGYTHTQRGNARGALSLLERAIVGLDPSRPAHRAVDIDRAITDARRVIDQITADGPSPDLPFPTFPMTSRTGDADR